MTRDREKFLFDIADSARFVLSMATGETADRYVQDRVFRGSMERELQIIGEAMLQLRTVDPKAAATFSEYERIIGFRHVLVHGYDTLDPEVVWYIVTQKLPVLLSEVEEQLKK